MDNTTQESILNAYQVESIVNLLQFKSVKSDCCFRLPGNGLFYGHTLVLAHYSPVFKAMFFGPFPYEESIPVTEVSEDDFVEAMGFLYTGAINFRSVEHAWSICYISTKYLLKNLEERCHAYIKSNLSLDNLLLSYEYALFFNLPHMIVKCKRDILLLASDVLAVDYHIQAETLSSLLEESWFNLPERCIIEYTLNWAETECKSSNLEVSPSNIRAVLSKSSLLSKLRFKVLSGEDYTKFCTQIYGEDHVPHNLLNTITTPRFPLHLSLLYKFRKTYRIEKTVKCRSDTVYSCDIFSHDNSKVYGIAISAPIHSISFKAQVTLEIFSGTKILCSKIVDINFNQDDIKVEYEHPLLVNLDKPLLFETGCDYTISLKYEYKNLYNIYGNFLVFYSESDISVSNANVFTFKNENFPGVVKGIAYYKV